MTDATAGFCDDDGPRPPWSRRLSLVAGVIAGPVLAVETLVMGAVRPGYSPLSHDVSSLALGDFGWIHSLTFMITGLLTLAFALFGLRPVFASDTVWGPRFVGIWALGLIVLGLFVTDPTTGYPQEIPEGAHVTTVWGVIHDIAAAVAFLGLIAALVVFTCVFVRCGRRRWAWFTALSASVTLVAIGISSYGSQRTGGMGELDGLFQRIAGLGGIVWLTVLAVALVRTTRRCDEKTPSTR